MYEKKIDALGKTQIKVDNAENIDVLIVNGISHDMILGNDTLMKGKGVINYPKKTLTWFHKTWPLTDYKEIDQVAEIVKEPRTVGVPEIDDVLAEYSDVFSDKEDPHGCCDTESITIDTEGHPPIRQRAYRTPLAKRKIIEEEVEKMLKDDVIQPSSSPWSSPVTLVPKPDGSTRFCVDYRQLNKVTRKDRYPLPLIQDIFDQVGGASIFTTLDLKAGYWQIPVSKEDIPKTAFVCHKGLYEFKRLPFGLANAPSQFQRIMDKVLAGLVGVCVLVYIDDLVIYSKDEISHAEHLKLVFERLRNAGLKIKPSKCCFAKPEVKLLGYIINKDGIRSNPEKVSAIQKLNPPSNVKGVRSFLGMCNYYAQTLPSYAKVAEPLYKLTRKNEPFVWGPEQQQSFTTLKELLGSNSVMAYPRVNQPYKLYTDACGYAIGGILVQEDENGTERVIQYVSHQLSGSQLKWATIEKEAYSVVYCINKLRSYL